MVARRLSLLVLACTASAAFCIRPAIAADNVTPPTSANLTRYIEQVRADWNNIGAAVAVVQGSMVVYARGFGVRESGKTAPIDADTLFEVASTTKAFTAAALGVLVEEGKAGWDDAIVSRMPAFQLSDPWITRQVTLRDALSHRAGVRSTYYSDFGVMDSDEAIRQLRYVAPKAFRDGYRYDNVMYGVVGKVIEMTSGMSWRDFVKQRLLLPLHMNRSRTSPYELWNERDVAPTYFGTARSGQPTFTDARDPNVAMPHLTDEEGTVRVLAWQNYDFVAGAGAIISSASDMANWLVLNLNAGRFAESEILKKSTVHELHAVQNLRLNTQPFPFEQPLEGYAMGWERGRYRDTPHLSHGGSLHGFSAYVAMLPEKHIGIVVLSNGRRTMEYGDGFAFHKAIVFGVFDRFLPAAGRNWSREFLDRAQGVQTQARQREADLQRARSPNAPASLPLERYVGEYENLSTAYLESGPILNGRLRVSLADDGLRLSFTGEGAFSGRLEHWHHDVFRLHPNVPVLWREFASFSLSPEAKIGSFTLFGQTFVRVPFQSAR